MLAIRFLKFHAQNATVTLKSISLCFTNQNEGQRVMRKKRPERLFCIAPFVFWHTGGWVVWSADHLQGSAPVPVSPPLSNRQGGEKFREFLRGFSPQSCERELGSRDLQVASYPGCQQRWLAHKDGGCPSEWISHQIASSPTKHRVHK